MVQIKRRKDADQQRLENNRAHRDTFYDELKEKLQDTEFGADFFVYRVEDNDCENVWPIPFTFLKEHGIPPAPDGRQYYCTAYGDLWAYPDKPGPDRKGAAGVGFNFDTWYWDL